MFIDLKTRRFVRRFFVLLLTIVAAGCNGERNTPTLTQNTATKSNNTRSTRNAGPSLDSDGQRTLELHSAINETIGFPFTFNSGPTLIKNATLSANLLTRESAPLDATSVQLFRREAVFVENWPGWHIRSIPPDQRYSAPLDALVPLNAQRGGWNSRIEPNFTGYFWADLTIPKGTPAGLHELSLDLTANGKTLASLRLQINVWPFVLPDSLSIATLAELDHRELFRHHITAQGRPYAPPSDDWRNDARRDDLDRLLRSTFTLLYQHGLNPVLPQFEPLARVSPRGEVEIDWSAYDATVEPLMNGAAFPDRVPLAYWPIPVGDRLSRPNTAQPDGEKTEKWAAQFLTECARHFREKGWLDRSYVATPDFAEPSLAEVEWLKSAQRLRDRAGAKVRLVSSLWPQDLSPLGWTKYPPWNIEHLVDIWSPPAQFYDPEVMNAQSENGRSTWMKVDRPPFSGSIDARAPLGFVRVLPWQTQRVGATVLNLGPIDRWPAPDTNPTPADCIRENPETLIYPGRAFGLDEPIASIRLKQLRRGMQDTAYIKLLREHDLGHVADALVASIVRAAGTDACHTSFADGGPIQWVTEDGTFEDARIIMANEIMRRDQGAPPPNDPYEEFAQNSVWRRFMLNTRTVQTETCGVRIRPSRGTAAFPISLEAVIAVSNQTRVPFTGRLTWTQVPNDWHLDDTDSFITVSRDTTRLTSLRAALPGLAAWPYGQLTVPFAIQPETGPPTQHVARAACIMAQSLPAPIRIDANLADWPLGSANVAGNFQLIAPTLVPEASSIASNPKRKTLAFAAVDQANLYIALNCESSTSASKDRPRRNTVTYDDLIPIGDELAEILIDPLNCGSRSPADLFHIVIKRTGMVLTERGVRVEPPCGTSIPWPTGVEAAALDHGDHWTAELRIPLSSFEPATTHGAIWGFNVTRFDADNEEYSTWSGANRNAYDPASLGNLYLP